MQTGLVPTTVVITPHMMTIKGRDWLECICRCYHQDFVISAHVASLYHYVLQNHLFVGYTQVAPEETQRC